MIKKIVQFVSGINQILLFIAAILIIVMISKEFFSSLNRQSYDYENRVELETNVEQTEKTSDEIIYLNFVRYAQDVYIFDVMSVKIDPSVKYRSGSSEYGMSKPMGPSPGTVNMLFQTDDNNSYMLFERNCLVEDFRPANQKVDNWKEMKKNLYGVITGDTNNDGYLSPEDRNDFYVSDYDGKNLKLVLKNSTNWRVIKDNTVFITQGEKATSKFYLYEVTTGDLKKINIGLTKHSTLR